MIKTTQCYLCKDDAYLMLLRNKKANDINEGKWIGVGGKIEKGETPRQGIAREILEETGLAAEELDFRGIVYFEYDEKESEKIYVYTCKRFHGELTDCNEGTLAWIHKDRMNELNLWEGDKVFLKRILADETDVFCIRLAYDKNDHLVAVENLPPERED